MQGQGAVRQKTADDAWAQWQRDQEQQRYTAEQARLAQGEATSNMRWGQEFGFRQAEADAAREDAKQRDHLSRNLSPSQAAFVRKHWAGQVPETGDLDKETYGKYLSLPLSALPTVGGASAPPPPPPLVGGTSSREPLSAGMTGIPATALGPKLAPGRDGALTPGMRALGFGSMASAPSLSSTPPVPPITQGLTPPMTPAGSPDAPGLAQRRQFDYTNMTPEDAKRAREYEDQTEMVEIEDGDGIRPSLTFTRAELKNPAIKELATLYAKGTGLVDMTYMVWNPDTQALEPHTDLDASGNPERGTPRELAARQSASNKVIQAGLNGIDPLRQEQKEWLAAQRKASGATITRQDAELRLKQAQLHQQTRYNEQQIAVARANIQAHYASIAQQAKSARMGFDVRMATLAASTKSDKLTAALTKYNTSVAALDKLAKLQTPDQEQLEYHSYQVDTLGAEIDAMLGLGAPSLGGGGTNRNPLLNELNEWASINRMVTPDAAALEFLDRGATAEEAQRLLTKHYGVAPAIAKRTVAPPKGKAPALAPKK
jgi:hypothetical protein